MFSDSMIMDYCFISTRFVYLGDAVTFLFLHVRFWSKEVSLGHDTVKILEIWPQSITEFTTIIVSDLEFVQRIAVKKKTT